MPKLSQRWVVKTQVFNVTTASNYFTNFHIFVSGVYNFWPIVIKLGQIWDFCIAIRTTPKFLKSEEICPSYGLITEENFLDHFSCAFHPFFSGIFFQWTISMPYDWATASCHIWKFLLLVWIFQKCINIFDGTKIAPRRSFQRRQT